MFVYAFGSLEGYVKIGVSSNPKVRLGWVQYGVPFELTCIKTWEHSRAQAVERVAHARLATLRASGEWFKTTPEIVVEAVHEAISYIDAGGQAPPPHSPRRRAGGRQLAWTDGEIETAVQEQGTYKKAANKLQASEITVKRRMAAIRSKREKEAAT